MRGNRGTQADEKKLINADLEYAGIHIPGRKNHYETLLQQV